MTTFYTYKATVLKVVDGDTVDLKVDLGFRVSLDIRTRIRGINAPESWEAGGKEATEALRGFIMGKPVAVTTAKDPTDKYGRWLADIVFDGQDVGAWLLANGHAKPYK